MLFHPDGTCLLGTNWNESISVWDVPLQTDEGGRLQLQQARRCAADERALFWHVQEAEHSLEHKNASAVRFHLQRLVDAPLSPPLQERKKRLLDALTKNR